MTAADRSTRQTLADHTTRPERVEAVTRDLWADVEHYTDKEH